MGFVNLKKGRNGRGVSCLSVRRGGIPRKQGLYLGQKPVAKRGGNPCLSDLCKFGSNEQDAEVGWPTRPRRISAIRSKRLYGLPRGEPFEQETDGLAGQKDSTVLLSDRHVPVPIGVSKVPEASGFFRGVAELGVVTVLGATFQEVNPVARGWLKLVDARQASAQLA
jgi:hypothetical protein